MCSRRCAVRVCLCVSFMLLFLIHSSVTLPSRASPPTLTSAPIFTKNVHLVQIHAGCYTSTKKSLNQIVCTYYSMNQDLDQWAFPGSSFILCHFSSNETLINRRHRLLLLQYAIHHNLCATFLYLTTTAASPPGHCFRIFMWRWPALVRSPPPSPLPSPHKLVLFPALHLHLISPPFEFTLLYYVLYDYICHL